MPASDLLGVADRASTRRAREAANPERRPPNPGADLPDDLVAALDDFFGPRAADVDAGRASVRDGIVELARLGAFAADLPTVVAVVARVARHDLASAFSAWAHRMAIEYLAAAPESEAASRWGADLRAGRRLGATAMAAGTAHVLAGSPLPVAAERSNGRLVLRGRVPWSSNLLPPFVVITAAVLDAKEAIVVALTDETPGLRIEPYPDLLALGATGSSSIVLDDVPVGEPDILALDLGAFVERILPPFLLVQSAFCLGLADRALDEAAAHLGPFGDPLRPELEAADAERGRLAAELARLARLASNGCGLIARRELLALRLAVARLAGDAVRLELAAVGGRAFVRGHPTARRLREAAFLPIQSPTEVLLRWLLSREA